MKIQIVWWQPTGNYLHTFVHEFAHSAHYHNLRSRGNEMAMMEFKLTRVPTVLGRFITKFKLGRYSATNMNEFMAERIAKDVCNNLNKNNQFIGSRKDIDYTYIFSQKWSYRYTCPQAYLDYYTQQIWNGDKEKANDVLDDMDRYLKKIEAKEVHPVVQKTAETLKVKNKKTFLSRLADRFLVSNQNITKYLDEKNELRPELGLRL